MAKKAISVHVTDEERSEFMKAMARDHMVDLGPWIATVVRKHIAADQERDRQLDLIEKAVLQIQTSMLTKKDLPFDEFQSS
jgi:hypothetical protein